MDSAFYSGVDESGQPKDAIVKTALLRPDQRVWHGPFT
jgi:hypothetical protein